MSDYKELRRLADELMNAVHLSIGDEGYLHSPGFGSLLEDLLDENESLRSDLGAETSKANSMECLALKRGKEQDELRKDAERYRWLGANPCAFVSTYSGKWRVSVGEYTITDWHESRDEAIDAAISSPENPS